MEIKYIRRRLKKIFTTSKVFLKLLNIASGRLPKILCYHRFSSDDMPMQHRVNAVNFAWQLDTILKDFKIISLEQCVNHFVRYDRWPRGSIILTIDDGYQDMYMWAWPELKKRAVSATFFVTTGFVDGATWLWPDRLKYALQQTEYTECSFFIAGSEKIFSLKSTEERNVAWKICSDHCISLPDHERQTFILNIEKLLRVTLPSMPPPEFAAVTWKQLCEMCAGGLEVGGHTVTHPILSKIGIDLLDDEIGGCRQILQERLSSSISSFCYPNGCPADISNAVVEAVARAGFIGAVVIGGQGCRPTHWDPYQLPRMTVGNDRSDFLWKIYGGEALLCSLKNRFGHA